MFTNLGLTETSFKLSSNSAEKIFQGNERSSSLHYTHI